MREKIANLIPLTFSGGFSLSREHSSRSRIVRASLRRARHLLGPTPSLLLADAGFLGYITEDQVLGLRMGSGLLLWPAQGNGPLAFCSLPLAVVAHSWAAPRHSALCPWVLQVASGPASTPRSPHNGFKNVRKGTLERPVLGTKYQVLSTWCQVLGTKC